jgi:hypothetical protein
MRATFASVGRAALALGDRRGAKRASLGSMPPGDAERILGCGLERTLHLEGPGDLVAHPIVIGELRGEDLRSADVGGSDRHQRGPRVLLVLTPSGTFVLYEATDAVASGGIPFDPQADSDVAVIRASPRRAPRKLPRSR